MAVSLKRSLGLATLGAPLLLVVTLSSCGDDDTAGSTVVIQSSSFTTILATTATTGAPPAEGSPVPGQTVAGTQVYEVQSGDYLSGIAADYGIPVDSLVNFNDWPEGIEHVLQAGDTVNIPPGAQVPDPDDDEDEESDETDEESDESESTEEEDEDAASDEPELCPDGEPQGTYTIEAGDTPAQVAAALDVPLDELNEANANTQGYSGFIVGIEINVPCGGGESESNN